jgi:hypothetical protein
MNTKRITLAAIALVLAGFTEPTEAEKVAALKLAYELNGNSMVRWGSIDLSGPKPWPPTPRVIPGVAPTQERKR